MRAVIDPTGDIAEIVEVTVIRQDQPRAQTVLAGLEPKGSVSAAILRSVKLTEILVETRPFMKIIAPTKRLRDPSKMSERSGLYYATWASLYVQAVERNPRRVIADLAEAHDMKPAAVRDLIHRCRPDFLTGGVKGRAGGNLTQLAIDTLNGATR